MASKYQPMESKKNKQLFKEWFNLHLFNGGNCRSCTRVLKQMTADETGMFGLMRDETETNGKGVKDPGETQKKHPWLTLACQDGFFN